ncbi:MAG: T9SS type A sorting domain-containing protein [Crocinitomicaceae bacterium]|nr:T9SS type A sorting domain-containing protein [Crocinitomicaceae bacterium]
MMKKYALILLCCIGGFNTLFAQTIRYVKPLASGTGNGSSWANASNDLQSVINSSASGDEIWVASGTYIPTKRMDMLYTSSPGDRQNAFVAKGGVNMYGGFIGNETSLSQRDVRLNETILSGDLNQNDGEFTNMTENSYHVIVFAGTTLNNTVFDGFTIADAYYREGTDPWDMPTVNSEIIHNHFGGSMYISNASPVISNVTFTRNFVWLSSGLFTQNGNGSCNAIIRDCVFKNNKGGYGGAVLNYFSNATFTNVLFKDNEALFDATISNASLQGGDGGAVYNWTSTTTFTNCTFLNNTAAKRGGGFYHTGGTVTVNNTILYDNTQGNTPSPLWQHQVFNSGATLVLNNNIIQDWVGGSNGNLDATGVTVDDLFEDYVNGNFYLKTGSIAIDAGNNTFVAGIVADLDGNNRILNTIVDLGVYEGTYAESLPNPIAVDDTASTVEEISVNIVVLANDTNTTNVSVTIIVQPENGTASVDITTGIVTYVPNTGFFGNDTLTYSICNDANECDTAIVVITVTQNTLGLSSLNNTSTFWLYPNPSKGNATLIIDNQSDKTYLVELYDALGKQVQSNLFSLNAGKNEIILNGNELQKGMYLIHVKTGSSVYYLRWILNK